MPSSARCTPIKAILGGTFNPPHMGHINAALSAASELGIETVHLMPSKVPPHKPVEVSEDHRVRMIELCCEGQSRLVPELIELSLPSPSYTVKTLSELKEKSERTICFFIGADSLYNLNKWFEWDQLLNYCHLVVMRRDGENFTPGSEIRNWLNKHVTQDMSVIHKQSHGAVILINTPLYPVSSTDIRNALCVRKTSDSTHAISMINEWVPRRVLDYINANQLYKS